MTVPSGVSTGRCIPVDRGWPYGREGGSDIRLSLERVAGFIMERGYCPETQGPPVLYMASRVEL